MPSYALVTFGCQMNVHDSERMTEVLSAAGYTAVDEPEAADVVLLNTCSVREKAEHKLRSEVGRLGQLKQRRPELLIGVAGCVAQQEGEKLLKGLPQIDLILGPDNIGELPGLLRELQGGAPPKVRTVFDLDSPRFLQAQPQPGQVAPSAFVTVMKGCDERCTYCIVPHTRGPERYRASGEIVAEVQRLTRAGVREITLLGQTVNSYSDPSRQLHPAPGAGETPWTKTHPTTAREDESEFAALARAIAAASPDLARLRYTSPHPRHLTMSLIRAHQDVPVLARHVHLPVQSGSDAVLKRMLRRYDVAEYLERVDALRAAVPGLTLSTDVIVGFPGETRADFEATLSLVERVGFVGLFGFMYSERPYTPALRFGDDVPAEEKSARLAELFALSESIRRRHLRGLVGSVQDVLVEGPGKHGGFTGRSEQNEIVHFGATEDVIGRVLPVRIVDAFKNSLAGELCDGALRAPLPVRERPPSRAPEALQVPLGAEPRKSLPVI